MDRGGTSSELITRKDLEINYYYYYYDEESQEFDIFVGCGKAFPVLSWTHKCECRLEI